MEAGQPALNQIFQFQVDKIIHDHKTRNKTFHQALNETEFAERFHRDLLWVTSSQLW